MKAFLRSRQILATAESRMGSNSRQDCHLCSPVSRTLLSALASIASLLLIFFAAPLIAAEGEIARRIEVPLIHVSGRGEVMAAPDRAVVRLAVETNSEEAAGAQNQVNEIIKKTVAGIRKAGIPEEAIRTSGLSLTPIYSKLSSSKESAPPKILQYRAATSIEVRVDEIAKAGQVIDAGLQAGANRLEGISFELKDELPSRTRALRLAVNEARQKAEAIAGELGVRIRKVRDITEEGVHLMPQPRFARAEMAGISMAPTEVQPGELRIQASVTVQYEIGP